MMSLYAQYVQERLGDEIIETEHGFATYRFIGNDTVYLVDIYVVPEFRRSNKASAIADSIEKVARTKGCKKMLGTVVPSAKTSTNSVKALLGYGMRLQSSTNDLIVFEKDL